MKDQLSLRMDEKQQQMSRPPAPLRTYSTPRASRRSRTRTFALVFLTLTVLGYCYWPIWHMPSPDQGGWPMAQLNKGSWEPFTAQAVARAANKTLVPLEAHVMSKCPDARDCLRDLIVPTMVEVSGLVDFRLSFIGEVDDDDGVTCKHGESECIGNILSLCAAHLYPNSTKISLGFSNCLLSSYQDIPSRSLVQGCALEHAVDFNRLNTCASEAGSGLELLKDSVKRSKDKGVRYSCTVRLAEDIRCIRDGGEWRDCQGGSSATDLIKDVRKVYKELNE